MAFKTEENDLKGILTLLLLTIPSLATTNIDCNGKAFHCENSTHFKICVDLGGGVSSTIDDFVIPCPPTTFCQESNRFECEFLAETSSPSAAIDITSITSTEVQANEGTTSIPETNIVTSHTQINEVTTLIAEATTSVPLEEYYNTLSTLSESLQSSTVKSMGTIVPTQAAKSNYNAIISTETSKNTESTLITITDSNVTPTDVFEENKESFNSNGKTNTLITEPPLASTTDQMKGNVGYKGTDTFTTTLTSFTEDFDISTEISTNSESSSAFIDNSIQNTYFSNTFATLATFTKEFESITKKEIHDFLHDTEKVEKVQRILENSTDGKLTLNEKDFSTGSIDNISSQQEPTTIKLYLINDNKTDITILSTEPPLKVTGASITDSKQATVEKVSTINVITESTANSSSHTETLAQSQQATLTTSLPLSKTPSGADNFLTKAENNNTNEITTVSTEPTMQDTDALITDSEVATILKTSTDNVGFTSTVNASSHTGTQNQEETLYTILPLSMTTNNSADIYLAKIRINNEIEITTASTEPTVKVTDDLITDSELTTVENTLPDNIVFTSTVSSSSHTGNVAQNQEETLTTSLPLSVTTNTGVDIYSTTIAINNINKITTVSTEPTIQVTDALITDSELSTVLKTSTDNVVFTSILNTSPHTKNEAQNQEESLYTLPLSMTTNNSADIYSAKIKINNKIGITKARTEPTVKVTDDLITDSKLATVVKTLPDNVLFTATATSSLPTGNLAQNQEETLTTSSPLSVATNTGADIYTTTIGIYNENKIMTVGTEPTVQLTDVLTTDVVSESTVNSSPHTEDEAQSQQATLTTSLPLSKTTSGADSFSRTVGINNDIEITTDNTELKEQVTDDLLTDSEPATGLKTLTDDVFFTPTMTTDDIENIAQNQEGTLATSLPLSKINNSDADIYSAKIRIMNKIEITTASTEPIVKVTDALELPIVEKAVTDNFVFTSTVNSSSHTGREAQNQEETLTTSLPLPVSTNTDKDIYSRTIGINNKTEITTDGTKPTVQLTDVLKTDTEPSTVEQTTAPITNAIENVVVFTSNVNSSSETVAQNQETILTTRAPLPDTTKDKFVTIEGTTNHDHAVFTTNVNVSLINSTSRQTEKAAQNQLETSSSSPELLDTSVDTANKSINDVVFTSHTKDSINTESSNTDSSTASVGIVADNVIVFSTTVNVDSSKTISSHTEDIARNQETLSTSSTLPETTLDTENLSLIDKIVTSQVNDSLNIFSTNADNLTTPAEVKNEPVISSNVNVDSLNIILSSQPKNEGQNNFATLSTSPPLSETTVIFVTNQLNDKIDGVSSSTVGPTAIVTAKSKNVILTSNDIKNATKLSLVTKKSLQPDNAEKNLTFSTSTTVPETIVDTNHASAVNTTNDASSTASSFTSIVENSERDANVNSFVSNALDTSNASVITKTSLRTENEIQNECVTSSASMPISETSINAVNIAPVEELVTTQSKNTIDSASSSILPVDKDEHVISTTNVILNPLEALLANKSASQMENLSQSEYVTMSSQSMQLLETTLDTATFAPIDINITSQVNDTGTAFNADLLTQTKSPIAATKLSVNEIIASMTTDNLSDSLSTLKEQRDETITIRQNDLNEMQGQIETRSSPAATPDTIQMVSSGNIIIPLPITQYKVKEEHITTKPDEVTDILIGSFKIDSSNDTMPIERKITSTVASFVTKYSSDSTAESETKIKFSPESPADSIGTHDTTYTKHLFSSTPPTPVEIKDNVQHENAISITSTEQIVHTNDSSITSSKPATFEQKLTARVTTDDVIFKTKSLNTTSSHNESLSSSSALSETTVDPDNVSPIDIFATQQISSIIDKTAASSKAIHNELTKSKINDAVSSGMRENKITIDTNLLSTSGPNTFTNAFEPLDTPEIMMKVVSPEPTTFTNAFESLVTLANVKIEDFDNQLQNERIINFSTTPSRNVMEVNPKLQTSQSVTPIATEVSYRSTVASLQGGNEDTGKINHNVFTTAVEASVSTVEGTKYSSVNAENIFNQKSAVFNQRLPVNSVSRQDVKTKVLLVNKANNESETLGSTFSTRSIEDEIFRNPTADADNLITMDNTYNNGQTKTQDSETRNLQNFVLNASNSEVKNLLPVTNTAPSNLQSRYYNVRNVTESSQKFFLFSEASEAMKESLPDTSLLNEQNKDIPTQTWMQEQKRTSDAMVLKKDLGDVPLGTPEIKIKLPRLAQLETSSPRFNHLEENKYQITTQMGNIISIPKNVLPSEPGSKNNNSEINQTADITTEPYSKSSVPESVLEAVTSIVNEIPIQSTAMPTDASQKFTQDYKVTQQLNLGLTTQDSPDLDKVTAIHKISDVQIVSIDAGTLRNTHSGLIIPNKKSSLHEKKNLSSKQKLESESAQNSDNAAIKKDKSEGKELPEGTEGIANTPSEDDMKDQNKQLSIFDRAIAIADWVITQSANGAESVTGKNTDTEELPRDDLTTNSKSQIKKENKQSTTEETTTKQLSQVTKTATESATTTESVSEQNNLTTPKSNDTKEINIPAFIDISTKPKRENKTITRSEYNTADIPNIQSRTTRYPPQTIPSLNVNNKAKLPALDSSKEPKKFVCRQNVRGRFSDSEHCRKFYICIGRPEPVEGICPNNTVFSDLRKQCTRNLSHCVRNNQFQCVTQGRFSDFFLDNTYYICVKNNLNSYTRFKLRCQNGYHLDKKLVRCVLNNDVLSKLSSMSETSKNNSDLSVSSTKKTIKKENKSKSMFKCKKEGKFADPSDCRRYFMCIENDSSKYLVKRKKCDSDEIFHKDMEHCVDAESYECK